MSERKLIGYVSVDSGMLSVVDPAYCYDFAGYEAKEDPRAYPPIFPERWSKLAGAVRAEKSQLGTGGWGSAVAFPTGVGDGIFPVYLDGNEVVIALDEWLWDEEDGRGPRPATQESATRLGYEAGAGSS